MTTTTTIIKPHTTSCKHCCFAQWEGDTQTDCLLGRIEAFRKKDPSLVLEVRDEEQKEFFVLNGRICRAYRQKYIWDREGETDEEMLKRVRQELSLRYGFVIPLLVMTGETTTTSSKPFSKDMLPSLGRLAQSIASLSQKPYQVIFVAKQSSSSSSVSPEELQDYLWDYMGNEVTWRIVLVHEDTSEYEQCGAGLEGRLIDIGVSKLCRSVSYYAVFYPHHEVPRDFCADLDRAINEKLERFILLTADQEGAGFVLSRSMHLHPDITGHALVGVLDPETQAEHILWRPEDKMRLLSSEDEQELINEHIRPVYTVCSGMKDENEGDINEQ